MNTYSVSIKGRKTASIEVRVDSILPDDANWYVTKEGYARSSKYGFMHRYIMGFRKGDGMSHRYVDHIDGDRLNNTKSNLRVVTPKENSKNKSNDPILTMIGDQTSWVGVSFDEKTKLYTTTHKDVIYFTNKSSDLCALCYDSIIHYIYGEGKRLNDNFSGNIPLPITIWQFSEEQIKSIEKLKNKYTDYIGVKWTKNGWKAQLTINLGVYSTAEEAARAYDLALLRANPDKNIEEYEFNFPKMQP